MLLCCCIGWSWRCLCLVHCVPLLFWALFVWVLWRVLNALWTHCVQVLVHCWHLCVCWQVLSALGPAGHRFPELAAVVELRRALRSATVDELLARHSALPSSVQQSADYALLVRSRECVCVGFVRSTHDNHWECEGLKVPG